MNPVVSGQSWMWETVSTYYHVNFLCKSANTSFIWRRLLHILRFADWMYFDTIWHYKLVRLGVEPWSWNLKLTFQFHDYPSKFRSDPVLSALDCSSRLPLTVRPTLSLNWDDNSVSLSSVLSRNQSMDFSGSAHQHSLALECIPSCPLLTALLVSPRLFVWPCLWSEATTNLVSLSSSLFRNQSMDSIGGAFQHSLAPECILSVVLVSLRFPWSVIVLSLTRHNRLCNAPWAATRALARASMRSQCHWRRVTTLSRNRRQSHRCVVRSDPKVRVPYGRRVQNRGRNTQIDELGRPAEITLL